MTGQLGKRTIPTSIFKKQTAFLFPLFWSPFLSHHPPRSLHQKQKLTKIQLGLKFQLGIRAIASNFNEYAQITIFTLRGRQFIEKQGHHPFEIERRANASLSDHYSN
jgi:hypothetical protein